MLFDVKKPVEYYVEADGVRSPTFTMKVVELPAVDDAGDSSTSFRRTRASRRRRSKSGGDVAAIAGTEVRVRDHGDDGDAGRRGCSSIPARRRRT